MMSIHCGEYHGINAVVHHIEIHTPCEGLRSQCCVGIPNIHSKADQKDTILIV